MQTLKIIFILILVSTLMSCRKPFDPEVSALNRNYLVVEGLINTGADSTFIKLSRTTKITDNDSTNAETGANVSVESNTEDTYPLNETNSGNYVTPPLNLVGNKKYRLRIITKNGKIYLSDFVEVKISPPIDSITWEIKSNGLQVYCNTHDDSNKTIYYRWEYAETWQFYALYYSNSIANGVDIVTRNMQTDNIYLCWASSKISPIVLGSSIKLDNDIIKNNPLTFISSESEKVGTKYSILVRQYALTKEAFDFWENLKKNTESLGSIFDSQPSQLTGNIHNTEDLLEPVIGFISAGTIQQKRIFIGQDVLPEWKTKYPYDCDPPGEIYKVNPETGKKEEDLFFQTGILIPTIPFEGGHLGATKECADCTIRGTNKKPAFWQ